MDILYLLIPLSAVFVLLILAVFGWAVHRGQFEDLDREGERILHDEEVSVDGNQERLRAELGNFRGSVSRE